MTRSNDTIYMSDKKGSCAPGQTPQVKQTAGSGTLTMEVLGIFINAFFKLNEFLIELTKRIKLIQYFVPSRFMYRQTNREQWYL